MMLLIRDWKQNRLLHRHIALFLSCCFCLVMIAFRYYYTGNLTFLFLVWNLFLAFIPYATAQFLKLKDQSLSNISFGLLLGFWLLFFPNSPYILTDLYHLRLRPDMPMWYDMVLLLSFGWTGLMLGFFSLMDVQQLITRRLNTLSGWIFVFMCLVLGSFGIYLGRFQRYNSWEIVTNPFPLFEDIFNRLANPLSHGRTLGVTVLFSVFLLLAYLVLYLLQPVQKHIEKSLKVLC